MPAATFTTLRDAIYTILSGLSGAGQPLYSVHKAHNVVPGGFPVATVGPSDLASDFDTVSENLRTYAFHVYVWQPVENANTGEESAVGTIMSAVNSIINALDADYTLGGLADGGCFPTAGEIKMVEASGGDVIVAKITVKCRVVYAFQ